MDVSLSFLGALAHHVVVVERIPILLILSCPFQSLSSTLCQKVLESREALLHSFKCFVLWFAPYKYVLFIREQHGSRFVSSWLGTTILPILLLLLPPLLLLLLPGLPDFDFPDFDFLYFDFPDFEFLDFDFPYSHILTYRILNSQILTSRILTSRILTSRILTSQILLQVYRGTLLPDDDFGKMTIY